MPVLGYTTRWSSVLAAALVFIEKTAQLFKTAQARNSEPNLGGLVYKQM